VTPEPQQREAGERPAAAIGQSFSVHEWGGSGFHFQSEVLE
jgi:hypothetical protein